ncbi:MAG: hypothetical protein Q4G18_13005 [Myroides sp.]|nr:hypothetical protein [Myroides sp.]
MKNISLHNNNIVLEKDSNYIVIDPLYITEINNNILVDKTADFNQVREKCFPYTDTPFTTFKSNLNTFSINRLKKSDDIDNDNLKLFSIDSGSVIFIKENIFFDFITSFNYDELFESSVDLINKDYWNLISNKYKLNDLGIIVSTGINSAYEFDGSGTYKII